MAVRVVICPAPRPQASWISEAGPEVTVPAPNPDHSVGDRLGASQLRGQSMPRFARERLRCPSCGLVLTLRAPLIEFCPRCLAHRQQAVRLEPAAAADGPERQNR